MTETATAMKIDSPITGYRVVKAEEPEQQATVAQAQSDVNPLEVRLERRPEGALPSETNKIEFNTMEGLQKYYLTVSYAPVCGVLDGEEVCVERPLEFFLPAGQHEGDHQWIAATMRSLSLAARGGFIAKALQDLRKVTWTKGTVRYGVNDHGKPRWHDSEVAALAYAIQQMLVERGFLDKSGNELPVEKLVEHYNARQAFLEVYRDTVSPKPEPAPEAEAATETTGREGMAIVGTCPEKDCGGDLTLKDGCPTCVDCGYSKCG